MYFTNCKTLDELKAEYRKLAKLNHPDLGGDTETMKRINAEYEKRFEELKSAHNSKADENHQTTETAAEFIDIIEKLIHLDGLTIELHAFLKFPKKFLSHTPLSGTRRSERYHPSLKLSKCSCHLSVGDVSDTSP